MGVDEWVHDVDTDIANIIRELNKGFRPKNVTTAQRNALTNLYNGLIIFNTSTKKLNFYTGTAWEQITSA